jgi:hypothetical protein
MKNIKVEVEGTTPLLMNRFLDKQIAEKIKKRNAEVKEIPVEEKLYTIKGKPYIPARYFEACMIEAAKQQKIAGKGKSTYSKYVGATVSVKEEAILIEPGDWEPFVISAVNPMTRGRMIVTRPRFNKWGCSFTVVCEDDDIAVDTMEKILAYGGNFVGIGDWRPDKKGKFGKFRIAEFKLAEED